MSPLSQPAPAPPRPFRFPPFARARLANGLGFITCRLARSPLVAGRILLPAGAEREPPELAGLASFTAGLLDEGTERRSALELAAAVEGLGGQLSTGAGWDAASASVALLDTHLREGLEILGEVVRSPTFPPDELERARARRRVELMRRRDQPAVVATETFLRLVYGDGVYGRPLLGNEGSLERLDRAAVETFHREHALPDGSWLLLVGSFDPDAAARLVEETLAAWRGSAATAPSQLPTPPLLGRRRVEIVDRPGAPQTELRAGHAGIPRAHPDFVPVLVLNTLLGGKFTSRLNLALRERHGVTYGAASVFEARRRGGPFVISAAVANEGVPLAIEEISSEILRLQEDPVPEAELAEARDFLRGVFPYALQTVGGVSHRLELLALYDLADDYFHRYLDEIAAVTPDDVLRVARAHLDADRMAVVAVGPERLLRERLEG